jgi:DNA topoisomerase I
VFDASPVSGEKVQLLDGRYGPYVTDGVTNASLPKGNPPEELTFQAALDLLAARAALGPPKKKAARRKTATTKKAAPAKKAPTKKRSPAAVSKSAKKKSAK